LHAAEDTEVKYYLLRFTDSTFYSFESKFAIEMYPHDLAAMCYESEKDDQPLNFRLRSSAPNPVVELAEAHTIPYLGGYTEAQHKTPGNYRSRSNLLCILHRLFWYGSAKLL
jgi:hypothetical protein